MEEKGVEGEKERKGGLVVYKSKMERAREGREGWFVTRAQERQRRPASGLRSGVEKRARGKARGEGQRGDNERGSYL